MIRLKKSAMNFVVDSSALACMVGLLATGLLVRYVLPPGSGGRGRGAALEFLGLGRHDWGAIHFWIAVALIGFLVLHVALHWRWVLTTVVRGAQPHPEHAFRSSRRTLWISGLVFVIVLSGLTTGFLVWADRQVQQDEPNGGRRGRRAAAMVTEEPQADVDAGRAGDIHAGNDRGDHQRRRHRGKGGRCDEAHGIHDDLN